MKNEESRNDLGMVRVHNNVIASIASIAATEVDGVKNIGANFRSGFLELIGRKNSGGIQVEIDKNDELRLEVPLVIKYGYNIPEIASQVQENIRNALERMTSITIKDININILGVEDSPRKGVE